MKAIIPVAGLGTRMLPATKAIPKEMLTLVDKPLIQHVSQAWFPTQKTYQSGFQSHF